MPGDLMSDIKVDNLLLNDGTQRMDLAKAWVNFDGTAVTTDLTGVRDSFNVTSVIDNGTGDFTVTWDTDFANTDYCLACTSTATNLGSVTRGGLFVGPRDAADISVGSVDIFTVIGSTGSADGQAVDRDLVMIAAYGELV